MSGRRTTPKFTPITPVRWTGHYERIPGRSTCYHVSAYGEIRIRWYREDEDFVLPAKNCPTVQLLARKLNAVKKKYNGWGGGSFIINEFGNVLVPTTRRPDFPRFHIGDFVGDLSFQNPFEEDDYFTLGDAQGIEPGQAWPWPYIGNSYHMTHEGDIYRLMRENDWTTKVSSPHRDRRLESILKKLRPTGCRFIVNHYGYVITKVQKRGVWEPYYVGKINFARWFPDGGAF